MTMFTKNLQKNKMFRNVKNRKMGLNWPLRARKKLKIRLPESFLIPRRLARSLGPPGPLKTSKNRFYKIPIFYKIISLNFIAIFIITSIMILNDGFKNRLPNIKNYNFDN